MARTLNKVTEPPDETVAERIHSSLDRLTPTERKVATILLGNYPFPGLETVAQFAKRGQVSNPTVLRLTAKLGFSTYAEFQTRLRAELQSRGNTPLSRGNAEYDSAGRKQDFLDRYRLAVLQSIDRSLQKISRQTFEGTAALLADSRRPVSLLGGRLTESLALQFHNHLRLIRPKVSRPLQASAVASEEVVDFDEKTILIVFDIRRYQSATIKLAREAHRRRATIILFTDIWLSPIAAFAEHVFSLETEINSSWDSFSPFTALVEALLTRVSERSWGAVRARMTEISDIRIEMGDDIP